MREPGVLARRPARPCAVAFSYVGGAAVRTPQSWEVIDGGGGSFSARSAPDPGPGQDGHGGAVPAWVRPAVSAGRHLVAGANCLGSRVFPAMPGSRGCPPPAGILHLAHRI